MALKSDQCKILLSQKKCKDQWEYRLSVMENISGSNQEKTFIKGTTEEEFLENLKNTLTHHELKNFERIQRYSRYSLTQKEILIAESETMKKVPQELFNKVRRILNDARKKMLVLV